MAKTKHDAPMHNALFIIAATALMSFNLHAQTCCSATQEFAALSVKNAFRSAHAEPRSASLPIHSGTSVAIPVPGEKPANVVMFKATGEPSATVLVIHEWWGLNDNIKNVAHTLYENLGKNVDVIAVDLYEGVVTSNREEAAAAMQNADADRIKSVLNAVIDASRSDNIGTIGWCFGGGWSLQASMLAGTKASACVIYYGMPEKDVDKLRRLNASVLGIFATEDKWITPEVVSEFQSNMTTAGKSLQLKLYKADHAFANPSNPGYDNEHAQDAWKATVEFFRIHLLQ